MKKYLFIGLMAVLATSCEKDPDLSKLDNNFTVYTNYDSKTNFNDFKTYCLPDSILLIGQGMKAENIKVGRSIGRMRMHKKLLSRLLMRWIPVVIQGLK